MKKICLLGVVVFLFGLNLFAGSLMGKENPVKTVSLSIQQLADKIKGGWAGKTIGCTYGGPVEFMYNGTIIQDYIPIKWPDGAIKRYYDTSPGLYDDVYMDLTFVEAFERWGLDVPVDSVAKAFATAGYPLWHANQVSRNNILQGIKPPASGNWQNNPHADDIDYQIEADYAGLMSPCMPNTASAFSDKIGHMICYGDGWYGGVFVGAMYAMAFELNDVEAVVTEALKTIPPQSTFYQCINDVVKWYKKYPGDWKQTWFECQKKWGEDYGCPDGVFTPFDIDSKLNSAYVVIGLLYGRGDYTKTLEIAARCGEDADCNPSTAGGILGTMLGYSRIPEYWKKNLYEVENRNFAYTNLSLNDAYKLGLKQALQVVANHGGKVTESQVTIACQHPTPVRYEHSFAGHYPVDRVVINKSLTQQAELSFEGIGIVVRGYVQSPNRDYVAKVAVLVDDQKAETVCLPDASALSHRVDLFWKYQLPKGKHSVSFRWLNPDNNVSVNFVDAVIYSDRLN